MMRLVLSAAVLMLAAGLAACGKKEVAAPTPPATNTAAPTSDMSTMDMTGTAMTGSGEGQVTALDKTAGTITLKHGPILGVKWPAMTMTFKANPTSLVDQVKVGDKVSFDVKVQGEDNEVTAIRRP